MKERFTVIEVLLLDSLLNQTVEQPEPFYFAFDHCYWKQMGAANTGWNQNISGDFFLDDKLCYGSSNKYLGLIFSDVIRIFINHSTYYL